MFEKLPGNPQVPHIEACLIHLCHNRVRGDLFVPVFGTVKTASPFLYSHLYVEFIRTVDPH